MGVTNKHLLDDVAVRMGITDPNDPRVQAEAERLLSLSQRRVIVLESHPNSGGYWFGKMGTEAEVVEYLLELAGDKNLDYVYAIFELKEGAQEETDDWLEFDDYSPVRVKPRIMSALQRGTPPLPGIERRLANIEAGAYGKRRLVWSILQAMCDQEIAELFSDFLEELLQSGRNLPFPNFTIPCPKCHAPMEISGPEHEQRVLYGGIRETRANNTLGEKWFCTNPGCEDGKPNKESLERSLLDED